MDTPRNDAIDAQSLSRLHGVHMVCVKPKASQIDLSLNPSCHKFASNARTITMLSFSES